MEAGQPIFVQSDDNRVDEFRSLKSRADAVLAQEKNQEEKANLACRTWFDVRAFGQLLAYSGQKKEDRVCICHTWPVSVHPAFSIILSVSELQITRAYVVRVTPRHAAPILMGMKHVLIRDIFVFRVSFLNSRRKPGLAKKRAYFKAVLPGF